MLEDVQAWFNFIVHWAMLSLSVICLFEASRCVVARRSSKASIALGAIGAILLLGDAAASGWGAHTLSQSLDEAFKPVQVHELSENSFPGMSAVERAENSRLLATFYYSRTGKLTRHFTLDGEIVTFAPNQQELREREAGREALAALRVRLEMLQTKTWALCIAVVVAAFAGAGYAAYARGQGNIGSQQD